jgi:hypothetical protein
LWEAKTFQGDKGEFTIQNGSIEIDGDTYGIKFWNNTQDTAMAGKTVTLSSTRSKHGLNGVVFEHESYNKKDGTKVEQDVIKVSKSGKVEWDGQAPKQSQKKSVVETIVNDNLNMQLELDRLVEHHMYINSLVRTAYGKYNYEEETIRNYVASVFIEANRKGLAFYKQKPAESEPEVDPADWGSVVVPSGHPKFLELGGKKLAEIGKPALVRLHQYFLENPSDKPFAKAVEQAAEDLQLGGAEELEQDDIPW